ncbi:MAG: hypothetical protein QXY37_02960 [Metallosphaera sp.]
MNLGVFLAALAMGTLELSEAGAVAAIYAGAYRSWLPYSIAALGVGLVLLPTFVLGKFLTIFPLHYILIAGAIILTYFGYRLLRSARRYFKKRTGSHKEKEGMGVVFVVALTEAFEDALVVLALMPQSYTSTLAGTAISAILVLSLTALLKSQISRIRLPQLKFFLSSLLFSLATLWILEVFVNITDLVVIPLFAVYVIVNYVLIRI